ncbi:MAG TPA: glutathione S-transferase family protein [Gammaproteobacteria bacterium]|nr:glutathione S-transferase family protein [Gammaproteobacteria bacterium]
MRAKLYVGNRNYSSWSIRGSLLVRQSGLDCDEMVIPLDHEDSVERIAAVSPSGRVPVLHADGIVVWDSLAIAEFLHERHPSAGLWPRDFAARALARSVSAEMHSGFGALRSQMPMDMRARHTVPRTAELVKDIARIDALWIACRAAHGSGGEFLFGAWSAADALYAPVVSRFRTYGVELSPVARAYANAVWQWPALQALAAEAAAEPWSLGLEI